MNNSINTPWGQSQSIKNIAPGIDFVSTAGHGGYHLSDERWIELKAEFPGFTPYGRVNGWLEEDSDWCFAALMWPELFDGFALRGAISTAKNTVFDPKTGSRGEHPCIGRFWDSPRGLRILAIVAKWEADNAGNYERGCLFTEGRDWRVHLRRISDGHTRTVLMRDYPQKAIYTAAELDALKEQAAA